MTDFREILDVFEGYAFNPFGALTNDNRWIEGEISVDFLNKHFGKYTTATEMKNVTESLGLKLYFDWLVEQGKLPA